jgi:putative ABC transport system permease protein
VSIQSAHEEGTREENTLAADRLRHGLHGCRDRRGLRRHPEQLGATKSQIRTQFLAESILLAVVGGVVGVLSGAAATMVYATSKSWAVVIPFEAWAAGILIGAVAGLMPAIRASRMPPTVALRTV